MADFPGAIKTFPTIVDGVDSVLAQHQNERGDEITAIETELGTTPSGSFSTVKDRFISAEAGIATLTAFGAFIHALTGKTVPVGADELVVGDSGASHVPKSVLLSNLYKALGTGTLSADVFLNGAGAYSRPGGLIKGQGANLTIAGGDITPTHTFHKVDTESGAATDDLNNLVTTNALPGDMIILTTVNSSRDVILKDNVGNFFLASDFTLGNLGFTITLMYNGANWLEVCRSSN